MTKSLVTRANFNVITLCHNLAHDVLRRTKKYPPITELQNSLLIKKVPRHHLINLLDRNSTIKLTLMNQQQSWCTMLKHPVHSLAFLLPYMGMDPINFPQFMGFKQKIPYITGNLWDACPLKVRGGYRTRKGDLM